MAAAFKWAAAEVVARILAVVISAAVAELFTVAVARASAARISVEGVVISVEAVDISAVPGLVVRANSAVHGNSAEEVVILARRVHLPGREEAAMSAARSTVAPATQCGQRPGVRVQRQIALAA